MDIEALSREINIKSSKKANFFPIDYDFLKNYYDAIQKVGIFNFLKYNLNNYPSLYAEHLLKSLSPLLQRTSMTNWKDVYNDIYSYDGIVTLTEFMYKYLNINSLRLLDENKTISEETKKKVQSYLNNNPYLLKLSEEDKEDFNEKIYGVPLEAVLNSIVENSEDYIVKES